MAAVVGEHLGGVPLCGDATLERRHHERRLLVVGERMADNEAGVVVHEYAHVQPLRVAQSKREDARLPELIRSCVLEAARWVLALGLST